MKNNKRDMRIEEKKENDKGSYKIDSFLISFILIIVRISSDIAKLYSRELLPLRRNLSENTEI